MDKPHINPFTRTGSTWIVLLVAICAWLATSFGVYRFAVTNSPKTLNQGTAGLVDEQQQGLASSPVEGDAAEDLQLAAANEDGEEPLWVREIKEANEERLAEEQEAEDARLAAEQKQAEEEQLAFERKQAEEERLAAEAQKAEEERLAAEAKQAEEERLAAEAKQAEEEQLAAEAKQAEEERLAAEAQKAEEERLASEAKQAEEKRLAAAEQARRDAAASTRLARFVAMRNDELRVLAGLSDRLRFESRSEQINRDVERGLDRIFDPLFLYSDLPVRVTVASNEYRGSADNNQLSLERGQSIASYLSRRGLDEGRLSVQVESGEGMPYGSHRVKVAA